MSKLSKENQDWLNSEMQYLCNEYGEEIDFPYVDADNVEEKLLELESKLTQAQQEIESLRALNDVETLVEVFSKNMQEIAEGLVPIKNKDDELVAYGVLAAKRLLNEFMVNYRLAAKGAKE